MASEDCIAKCAIGFGVALFLAISLALPVTEIVMGAKYKDDVVCDTSIVPIPAWLIVKGSVSLLYISLLGITMTAAATELTGLGVLSAIPMIVLGVFQLAWLIVGSVTFWRDCRDLDPESVNTLMWCSLIIGYVMLFIHWIASNKKKD